MRKGYLIGVALLLLAGCGGGQGFLTGSTFNDSLGSGPAGSDHNIVTKSESLHLESFVQLIHSDHYANALIVELDAVEAVQVTDNRLAVRGGRTGLVVNRINDLLDGSGADVVVAGLFGSNPIRLNNQARQYQVLSGKPMRLPGSFFRLVVSRPGQAEDLLRSLWEVEGVRSIHPALKPLLFDTFVPDLGGNQDYLRSYEETSGLSIEACWEEGIYGEGIHIVDLETDWNPDHIELPESPLIVSSGYGGAGAIAHGTAVLGIIVGRDDGVGIQGVSPGATIETSLGGGGTAAGWVDGEGSGDLAPGSVIVVETGILLPISFCEQFSEDVETAGWCGVPEDLFPDAFSSIERATAEGVTVVLGSGNSGMHLDEGGIYTDEAVSSFVDFVGGPFVDTRVEDSGAILVGASNGAAMERPSWSNCGARVDLFAWGSGIVAPSYPGSIWEWIGTPPPFDNNLDDPNSYYTNAFGGTSASAAIIAGTVALLQNHAQVTMGGRKYLTPQKVREILKDSGVAAAADGGCPVGFQPRMDEAINIFNDFWLEMQDDYPELAAGGELSGERRRALRGEGIGLICKLNDFVNSDPSCPETARCVLEAGYQLHYSCDGRGCGFDITEVGIGGGPWSCQSVRCLPLDVEASDYDCIAGAIWPSGLRMAQSLDFDGDLRADLVKWTEASWQIDLSSDELGAWNLEFGIPPVGGRWVWPVAEDYNSDGRADLSVYDKENGVWYIKFTDRALLGGEWSEWDREIALPYQDVLSLDIWETAYGRPVPGDYNGDGWIDLALARSDGIWSIDHGGPEPSDYGSFDQNVTYLTAAQLAEAPGWAYLPVEGLGTRVSYKVPDGVPDGGEIFSFFSSFNIWANPTNDLGISPFGGNDSIPLTMNGNELGTKKSNGSWQVGEWGSELESYPPTSIYGGLDCHPFVADFDGDGYDDRAVQCPTEFRIGLSSTGEALTVPLGYNRNVFSLPGKPYFGSISYATSLQIIDWSLRSRPTTPPIIPVDMVSGGFCRLPWSPGETPSECH